MSQTPQTPYTDDERDARAAELRELAGPVHGEDGVDVAGDQEDPDARRSTPARPDRTTDDPGSHLDASARTA